MNHLFISIALLWVTTFGLAGNPNYEQAMMQAIDQLEKADSPEAYQSVANQFQRIAQVEQAQWLPLYYAGYSYIIKGAMSKSGEQKDRNLDQAQVFLDQAQQLASDESELVTLQGYLHMIRVTVDPANRGAEFAPLATQTLARAAKINPNNPRAYLLLGQMQLGTAQFFNSDTSEACSIIGQAVAKYEKATTDNLLMPHWGEASAQAIHRQCNP